MGKTDNSKAEHRMGVFPAAGDFPAIVLPPDRDDRH
jgi:hypothetical protein